MYSPMPSEFDRPTEDEAADAWERAGATIEREGRARELRAITAPPAGTSNCSGMATVFPRRPLGGW